ncbi:hypothetical protein BDY17DRAFT_322753 [Neohortaea acidophila]|uniref:DUF7587 domain-containing protein n=1 Tax=Neohortaea acidophila TaxID=245834 RepID=A0A6A6PV63_9PEZI|nr:uncharacterized protein BDY17DRAFT_322753 [Neohortaea acidophila]KAF2483855.1 hypothetical protein BDY17DRAFT_322753 [Neohortaea acidophila]
MPASRKTTASRGIASGKLVWDTELRLALLLLKEDFRYSNPKAARVFGLLFKDHLRSCGVADPTPASIASQYYEKTVDSARKRWGPALRASPEQRQAMKARIDAVIDDSVVLGATQDHIRSFLYQPNASGVSRVTKRKDPAIIRSPKTPNPVVAVQENESEEFMQDLASTAPSTSPKTPRYMNAPNSSEEFMRDVASNTLPISPRTPRRKKTPDPNATVPFRTSSGRIIMITPEKNRIAKLPLVPIADTIAHPNVPLLFRNWCPGETQSPLTEDGFVAKRFAYTNIPPPPPPVLRSRHFPWDSFASHLNGSPVTSPFVSTSFNLPWIIRQGWELAKNGRHANISVIDPSLLSREAMFHVQPFQAALARKYCFDDGAWMYKGQYEMLVWAGIPKEAITFTFPFQKLVNLASADAAVGQILRLQQLSSPFSFSTKILPVFKAQSLPLSSPNVVALATLCRTLRISVTRPNAISCLVSDVVQGFALKLEYHTKAEWARLATTFANAFCSKNTLHSDYENTRWAFLDGCRWATGEPNARQKPMHLSKMLSRSAKIGLASPGEILMHDIDLARRSVQALEREQWEMSRGVVERGFLIEDARRVEEQVDEMEVDEMEVDIGDVGVGGEHAGIVYERDDEEDGDGDYDDNGSVFEL